MKILVVDGQGGGVGRAIIEQIRKQIPNAVVTAVGTNSAATSNMIKAGADNAATGENAIAVACKNADIITGPLGIILSDSMMGEITPRIALCITRCDAKKVLIPVSKCHTLIAGQTEKPLAKYINEAIELILKTDIT